MDLRALAGLGFASSLVDFAVLCRLATADSVAAERTCGFVREKASICDGEDDECCQVKPGAERDEDRIEEAGGGDMAVEVRARSLLKISRILDLYFVGCPYKTFWPIRTEHHRDQFTIPIVQSASNVVAVCWSLKSPHEGHVHFIWKVNGVSALCRWDILAGIEPVKWFVLVSM